MKKTLLLVCCLAVVNSLSAQRYEYGTPQPAGPDFSKTRFGLFVAPNISYMQPTANKSDDRMYLVNTDGSKMGFTWGLMIDYFFEENYGIATGFHLNSTGGRINAELNPLITKPSGTDYVEYANMDYHLQYLEIPFGLKLRSDPVAGAGGIQVLGQIGVGLGFAISKKASYDVKYYDYSAGKSYTIAEEKEKIAGLGISPIMMQLCLGGGFEYPVTDKLSLYLALFFNNGFAPDVTNPKEFDLLYKGKFTDGNTRLNNFALRLGLFF
jgi:hypothetical protein